MNAFTDLHAMLTAFFANLPWPVLLMDERGRITYANPALCEVDGAAVTPVGLELASCYPEYFAALRGEAPWRRRRANRSNTSGQTCSTGRTAGPDCAFSGALSVFLRRRRTSGTPEPRRAPTGKRFGLRASSGGVGTRWPPQAREGPP